MRKEIIILIFFCSLNFVSAEIILSPINISVSKGVENSFSINISNNYDFDIYKLTFSNLEGFTFPEINILKKTSQTINFIVKTNYSYDGFINSNVKFRYKASIPEDITTYNLTISGSGINNQINHYQTIRKGDSIRWKNLDDVTHNLQSTIFESSISPNNEFTRQFNDLSIIEYRSIVAGITLFTGTIEVINRTGEYFVYNPVYDQIYSFYFQSIPESTSLNASVSEKDYTIEVTNYKEGLLTIKNFGINLAENIFLSSDPNWVQFDENNFNLPSNEIKYIKFKIFPSIYDNNQTNLTYQITLKIKAINTNEYTSVINIFVPYSNVFSNVASEEWFVNWFNSICLTYPNSFLCNKSTINQTARIIYRESEFSINMSGSEWYNLVKRIGMMEGTNVRRDNKETEFENELKNKVNNIEIQSNQTFTEIRNFMKDQNSWTTAKWILGFFIFLSACIFLVVHQIRKLNKKKEIIDIYQFKK